VPKVGLNGAEVLPASPEPPRKSWGFMHFDAFMAVDVPDNDWIVPGVLEHGDRLIVTGGEGHGKSTLLRQWAVMAAAGVHWFTGEAMRKLRVGLLDLENSERQVRAKSKRQFGDALAGTGWPHNLVIRTSVEGLDILGTESDDAGQLRDFVHKHELDLLVVGPLYKLVGGNENDNERAKAAAAVLDQIRSRGCAIVMEAHNAKATDDKRAVRPREPVGASVWMRWPEYGLHLSQEGYLQPWRGGRGDGMFPGKLTRGGTWPWTADRTEAAEADPNRDKLRELYQIIEAEPGLAQRGVMDRTTETRRNDVGSLLAQLARDGRIRIEQKSGAHRHYVAAEWPLEPGEQGYTTAEDQESLHSLLSSLWAVCPCLSARFAPLHVLSP
jgi:hypothetical protein